MRFDDFDVVTFGEMPRRELEQLERYIHAHAHVRREHDPDSFAGSA